MQEILSPAYSSPAKTAHLATKGTRLVTAIPELVVQ